LYDILNKWKRNTILLPWKAVIMNSEQRQPIKKQKPTGTRMAMRGILYFMRTILLVVGFIALCYGVFNMALRMTNLYILTTDGMRLRAECILQEGSLVELEEYFTPQWIEKDELINNNPYLAYDITNYDQRIEVEKISVWPWSETATVTMVERMPSISGKAREEQAEGETAELPQWVENRYLIRYLNRDGRWYVYQLQILEEAPEPKPVATPDMRMTPQPALTPTPRPTATPEATLRPAGGV